MNLPLILLTLLITLTTPGVYGDNDRHALTEKHYHALQRVHRLIGQQRYRQALQAVTSLLDSTPAPLYDRAVMLQTQGYLNQKLNLHKQAIRAYREALSLAALPEKVVRAIKREIGRLLIDTGAYQAGLSYLAIWLSGESAPDNGDLALIASAHYYLGEYREAETILKKAIAQSGAPPEGWLRLLLSCYERLGNNPDAILLARELIGRFPGQRVYWDHLLGLYHGNELEGEALALQELMYIQGMLNPEEVVRLARSYLYLEMPYQAAMLLQKEMESGSLTDSAEHKVLLAESWRRAREPGKAIELLSEAAPKASDGQPFLMLGHLLFEREQWREAQVALQEAIRRGGLSKPGDAHLLLAISHTRDGNREAAQQIFQEACRSRDLQGRINDWIEYLNHTNQQHAPLKIRQCRFYG